MTVALLEHVEAEIMRGRPGLRFDPAIEPYFRKEYEANRLALAPLWGLMGAVAYGLLSFGDATMMPDVASALTIARFGFFIPLLIIVLLLLRRFPSAAAYDLASIVIAVAGTLAPMSILVFSNSPFVYAYQTGSVATFLIFAIALRPQFPSAVIGLALLTGVQLVTIRLNGSFDAIVYSGIVGFYATVAVFLALSVYFMEQKERSTFIHQLRGQLLLEKLEIKSEHDQLTGLSNRHALERWQVELSSGEGAPRMVAAIILDVDRFKLFNDYHGHIEGDECLRRVAHRVADVVGSRGRAFRYGGEEILVLLPDASLEEGHAVAEGIRASIESAGILHRGLPDGQVVTASLGVASGPGDVSTLKTLLSAADAALYRAKANGRNRVETDGGEIAAPAASPLQDQHRTDIVMSAS